MLVQGLVLDLFQQRVAPFHRGFLTLFQQRVAPFYRGFFDTVSTTGCPVLPDIDDDFCENAGCLGCHESRNPWAFTVPRLCAKHPRAGQDRGIVWKKDSSVDTISLAKCTGDLTT